MRSNGSSPRSRCRCSGRNRRGWIGSTYDVDRPIRIVRDDPRTAEARLSPFLPEPAATRPDVTFRQLIRRWWDHPDDLGGQATSRAAEVAAAVAQARRRKTEHLGRPNRVGEIEQLLRYAKRACQRPNMGILDLPPAHTDLLDRSRVAATRDVDLHEEAVLLDELRGADISCLERTQHAISRRFDDVVDRDTTLRLISHDPSPPAGRAAC